jgi:hypothetical protein
MAGTKHSSNSTVRNSHWIKGNEQNRIPKRWISFDTESRTTQVKDEEIQSWRVGAAIRWRRDLRTGQAVEHSVFDNPDALWLWVTDYCRSETRTVITAHNLGHDIRISRALEILPRLGWRLDWSNLDRNVSAMVWRSERGTLVFSDLFTWLPYPLREIGKWMGHDKGDMPLGGGDSKQWEDYCLRDADIVRIAVSYIVDWIESDDLGSWQPTGAGSAYSMWRHRFLTEKTLVHDDMGTLAMERDAMHTGRAEAWRHGAVREGMWHEVDMKSAYTWIASDCSLPAKLKYKGPGITVEQYKTLNKFYAICARVKVRTELPVVPMYNGERTIWPTGEFETVLWDVEIDQLLAEGAEILIGPYATYVRKPLLREWAEYVLSAITGDMPVPNEIVRRWLKHTGRALIGRLSLRIPSWDYYGENVEGITGISHNVDIATGVVQRMLHVGSEVFLQSERAEADSSLPQITGWIMAECRMRLWRAMATAGFENIAHVDTDSLLVSDAGLSRLTEHYGDAFTLLWQIKGRWPMLDIWGPRNYRTGKDRKISGVPKKAKEHEPGRFTGELWLSLGNDMEAGRAGTVTVRKGEWNVKMNDPRRLDSPDREGHTVAIRLTDHC